MDHLTALSVWGLSGLVGVLLWRLRCAHRANFTLEESMLDQQQTLTSHQTLLESLKSEHQLETSTLSDAVSQLQASNQQQQSALVQLSKDHEALQKRHRALEQNLLEQMKQVSTYEDTIQSQRLESAHLTQKLEQTLTTLQTANHENKRLHTTQSKLTDALAESRNRIERAEQEHQQLNIRNHQLERELQRELQKNVVLEDQLKQFELEDLEPSDARSGDPVSISCPAPKGPILPTFTS